MSKVLAKLDLRSASGKLLIAEQGREGVAIAGYAAYPGNYGKVPVRWKRRRKVYWHELDDLIFVEPPIDPISYVALPPDRVIGFPKMPPPPDPRTYDFGRNLRQFRKERGWRQRHLVAMLKTAGVGISQTGVSHWERNRMAPKGEFVVALARVFNIPAFAFFLSFHDCEHLAQTYRYMQQLYVTHCGKAPI